MRAAAGLERVDFLDQRRERRLRIPEEHLRLLVIEELVLDTGEAGIHAALHDDDVRRLIHVENGHSMDRAARIVAGGRIDDVVRPDDECDIGAGELWVDVIHVVKLWVGNVGFR